MPDPSTDANYYNGTLFNELNVALLAEACACDLTRFIAIHLDDNGPDSDPTTLMPATAQDPGVDPPIPAVDCNAAGNGGDCLHNLVAHQYQCSMPFTQLGGPSPYSNTLADAVKTQIRLARLNKYYMSHVATFAKLLNGYGLLDSSVIVAMSDLGDPNDHSNFSLPIVVLGSAGGYFKTGQALQMPKSALAMGVNAQNDYKRANGWSNMVPHNALLVSLCNAFGVPVTSYGVSMTASDTQGALPGLAA
jgi:hypothetical protein